MALSGLFKKAKSGPRVCVIGIDGVPFTFIKKRMAEGAFPNLKKLMDGGDMKQMSSVVPPISSVAWATFMTGKNPAKHGIFGFVDRLPETMEMKIPTSVDMKSKTLWEILSDHGKKVVAMNVPGSYPPRKVNGKLISCFLATDINKATYPPELSSKLKEIGYIIDVDPWKARQDRDGFLADLFVALEKRLETTLWLLESEKPDFLISHIMETDRLSHFFWEDMEKGDPKYAAKSLEFFDRVDDFIGTMISKLPEDTILIAMSDHGFCTLKKEVFLNVALAEAGFLKLVEEDVKGLAAIHEDTKAYSMIPGRIFVNQKGREKNGSVAPGAETEKVLADVSAFLMNLKDPDDGSPIISKVFRREEIYKGALFDQAADLLALPHDGYDLKGNLKNDALTVKDKLVGMHTDWDATLCVRGAKINADNLNIVDVMPSILSLYGINDPALDLDGRTNIFDLK